MPGLYPRKWRSTLLPSIYSELQWNQDLLWFVPFHVLLPIFLSFFSFGSFSIQGKIFTSIPSRSGSQRGWHLPIVSFFSAVSPIPITLGGGRPFHRRITKNLSRRSTMTNVFLVAHFVEGTLLDFHSFSSCVSWMENSKDIALHRFNNRPSTSFSYASRSRSLSWLLNSLLGPGYENGGTLTL
ncbi:hypothetical protein M413DRAFT_280286 [Hebeloma cylindrosporum]|uniref:Uncharacterized protein n=1 Tax=Hebeloma cylindrosporum TaxID=76867 RepID=A0A0C2XGH1_HEBCY|nr:hypothetical protein M413DRAFT_280286 [Hebeloma cylindrosporum h7]